MVDIPSLLPGAEPRFYRGNDIGVLVTHGFMASPSEVSWTGDFLAREGYTVYVPRLTGHGINPDHMASMIWQNWYAQVLDGYHILRQQCETVIAIGHSMGGLLSLLLSTQVKLDALVVSATPISQGETNTLLQLSRWLHWIAPFLNIEGDPLLNREIMAEQHQRNLSATGRVHYQRWSTKAAHQFYLLEQTTRAILPQVTVPLLLLYAEQDTTGTVADAQRIANSVRSTIIEQHVLADGGHIIFQDKGRHKAFAVIADFIKQQITQEE